MPCRSDIGAGLTCPAVMRKLSGRPFASVTAWTFGATNRAPEIPFLTRALDALRWAFRYVASLMTVFGSASAAARPSIIKQHTHLTAPFQAIVGRPFDRLRTGLRGP